jgi:hypothetical protein
MMRSLLIPFAPIFAALLASLAPQQAAAQYRGYPPPPPYQPPYPSYPTPYQPGPTGDSRAMGGTYFMSGHGGQPCQVIPSPQGDRAMFINENGGRAEGYIRGNTIVVPEWENLQGQFLGNRIVWSNASVWMRQ